MVSDYIYIVHCEQHRDTNIYKLGRTAQQEFRRFNGYPKNSELLLYIHVNNSYVIETELLKIFKEKYEQINSAGVEYFKGDVKEMIKDVVDMCLNNFGETEEKCLSEELLSTFPNYKYDVSFGGRQRLCMLKGYKLYYILDKELQSVSVNKEYYNNIIRCTNIESNVYFKYTEKTISDVINTIPYSFNLITEDDISYYDYNNFIHSPELLFKCNCKVGDRFISLSDDYKINDIKYFKKDRYLISFNVIKSIIPVKTMYKDNYFGVIFTDEYTDDVDCNTLVTRSCSIENDILLFYIIYEYILKDKECLVDNFKDTCEKYLYDVVNIINDIVNKDTIKFLYDPFKEAKTSKSVLKSFNNYLSVMKEVDDNLFDDNFNYGLYFLANNKVNDYSVNNCFKQFTEWINNNELNYHQACKWWFKQTWIINKHIIWNNIKF